MFYNYEFLQAYCPGPSGRSEPSFGRRRRSVSENPTDFDGTAEPLTSSNTDDDDDEVSIVNGTVIRDTKVLKNGTKDGEDSTGDDLEANASEMPEQVREMIEVIQSIRSILASIQKVIKSLALFTLYRFSNPVKRCNRTRLPGKWLLHKRPSV